MKLPLPWKISGCVPGVLILNFLLNKWKEVTFFVVQVVLVLTLQTIRSIRQEVFCKKGVLWNFAKFTGKHMWQSLFFNKNAGLRPATLLKIETFSYRTLPVAASEAALILNP